MLHPLPFTQSLGHDVLSCRDGHSHLLREVLRGERGGAGHVDGHTLIEIGRREDRVGMLNFLDTYVKNVGPRPQ